MDDMYNIKSYKVGQVIEGTVLEVTENEVFVDFNYATEGKIYLNQLTLDENIKSAEEIVKKGDPIKAVIKKMDDESVLLSRLDIERNQNFHKLGEKYADKSEINAKVIKELKNAFLVNTFGVNCIMPKNEVDVKRDFDASSLLDKEITVKIIEFDARKKRIVVSRRLPIAQKLYNEKLENYNTLVLGEAYEASVVRVEKYGLLVVVNNFQGLIPRRELSHLPFEEVTDIAKVGDKVNVKLIDKNDKKTQVLFSMRALLPKPWEVVAEKVKEGDVIEGTIVRITEFGAFVNIYPRVDGLLHKNEYSYNPDVNMFDEIEEGQKVKVKVIYIDSNRERLSLSIRALKEDPWQTDKLKFGDIVEMTVVDFIGNDAKVKFADDVEGILPKNHVSSEKRVTKAEDELSIGQKIKVKVIEFRPQERKLAVSIRRIKEDQERAEYKKYIQEQGEVKNETLGDKFGDKLKDLLK